MKRHEIEKIAKFYIKGTALEKAFARADMENNYKERERLNKIIDKHSNAFFKYIWSKL